MSDLVRGPDIDAARRRIRGSIHRTPLLSSRTLGARIGAPLFLKCENLQKTGSFKVRGALNQVLRMDAGARSRGVVTISAGNYAQALAWAAGRAQVPCTVVMPAGASPAKATASAAYGAEVVLHGTVFEAFEKAEELARERGLTFLHPFDDPAVIAGHGTLAAEILEDLNDVSSVVVPVGGGGLISGVASALAGGAGSSRVFGVEPEGAAAMRRSLDAGRPVRLDRVETIADGLAPPMAGALTFQHVQRLVTDVVTVPDGAIAQALAALLSRGKLLSEPAGAAGLAALLTGKIPVPTGGSVVVVVSGGNVDLEKLPGILAMAGPP